MEVHKRPLYWIQQQIQISIFFHKSDKVDQNTLDAETVRAEDWIQGISINNGVITLHHGTSHTKVEINK